MLKRFKQWQLDRKYRKCLRDFIGLNGEQQSLIRFLGEDPISKKKRGDFTYQPKKGK